MDFVSQPEGNENKAPIDKMIKKIFRMNNLSELERDQSSRDKNSQQGDLLIH